MSLVLAGLAVTLSGTPIVRGVDLVVPTGAFVGLLGPNGSGKSTLLKAIYRAHRPSAGRVLLDHEDLLAMTPRAAARRVAVLAQESHLEFDLTVTEMVATGRTSYARGLGRDGEQDQVAVAGALERVDCAALARRSFLSLSGGERQRVLVARAIAQGADHLLLDEPTNHLDIRYQVEVLELVASLGVTVLAALHDLSLAALFCDQVHLLAAGRLVAGGSPAEVLTADRIRAVYGAHVLVVDHPETGAPQLLHRRTDSR